MAREVELKLADLLKAKNLNQADFARRIHASPNLVTAYCKNTWTVLDRTLLERMADVLQCDPGMLLVTRESPFFQAYRNRLPYVYLLRPDSNEVKSGRKVSHRDVEAARHVDRLLEDHIDGIESIWDSAVTPEDFNQRLSENCIVVGSPIVNPAATMALCQAFGVRSSEAVPTKFPFHFRVSAQADRQRMSPLVQTSPDGKQGIWLRDEKELLEMEAWPPQEFVSRDIRKGRDCAVVVVMNLSSGEGKDARKLVILSGSSGVGTVGAAIALSEHYRDLEPRDAKETVVWGAIEVLYDKAANSRTREITGYNWRRRVGGRCPVASTSKVRTAASGAHA